MIVKRINLGWITVSNAANSEQFFTKVLGLNLLVNDSTHGWLELAGTEGGARLGVAQADTCCPDDAKPHNAIMTFTVDDIEAAKTELEQHNVVVHGEIVTIPDHVKMLSFADPDGNIFQLVQEL